MIVGLIVFAKRLENSERKDVILVEPFASLPAPGFPFDAPPFAMVIEATPEPEDVDVEISLAFRMSAPDGSVFVQTDLICIIPAAAMGTMTLPLLVPSLEFREPGKYLSQILVNGAASPGASTTLLIYPGPSELSALPFVTARGQSPYED